MKTEKGKEGKSGKEARNLNRRYEDNNPERRRNRGDVREARERIDDRFDENTRTR